MDTVAAKNPWMKPKDMAAREGADPRTIRRWIDKGAVEVRRLGPRTGVRVRYKGASEDN